MGVCCEGILSAKRAGWVVMYIVLRSDIVCWSMSCGDLVPGDLLCEDVVDRGVGRWHAGLLFGNIVYRVCGVRTLWRAGCIVEGCGERGRIVWEYCARGCAIWRCVLGIRCRVLKCVV
jgi:hypothetical protein